MSEDELTRQLREAQAELESGTARLERLRVLGRNLASCHDRSQVCKAAFRAVRDLLPEARSVAVLFSDSEFVDSPQTADLWAVSSQESGLGPLGRSLHNAALIDDLRQHDERPLVKAEECVILAPLADGILYVGCCDAGVFSQQDRALVEAVSYPLDAALRHLELQVNLERLKACDSLTGLPAHRAFHDTIQAEIDHAAAQGQSLVLAMVDLDSFKTYNEVLGHAAGDLLLLEASALLNDRTRAIDEICRYGGDEFAILFRDITKERAAKICEWIRESFQLRFGGNAVQVTASIGLACFPVDADCKKDLLQAADDALYVAKRSGRNMVAVSDDLEERRRKGPMVQQIKRPLPPDASPESPEEPDSEPPWEHPHTSPRKPPPKVVPGSGYRKLA